MPEASTGASPGPVALIAPGGERFWLREFDVACHGTKQLRQGMRELTRIARLITSSGRRAVMTVAPAKTAIDPLREKLRGVSLPHGQCARRGFLAQDKILDTWDDPSYVPLRQRLSEDPRQLYWHNDPHWNTVGASVLAKQLSRRLAPSGEVVPRYGRGTAAFHGSLLQPQFENPPEVGPALLPSRRTRVTVPPDEPDIDTEYATTLEHEWRTSPRTGTVRGRTLLLGDSFTYLGLNVLRPVVANGRFVWIGIVDTSTIVQEILDADTVVVELFQPFVGLRLEQTMALRRELQTALRGDRRPNLR